MKNKICILTSVHSAFDDRIFHKQAKSIVKNGYQAVLIAPHKQAEQVDGVNIVPLKIRKNRLSRLIFSNIELLKKAIDENAAVYHFHDPEIIPIGLVLKLLNKKVVYDIHEDVPRDVMEKGWIPLFLRGMVSKSIDWLEHFAGRRFDGMLGATPYIAKRFGGSDIRNVMSVCNYPMLEEFSRKNGHNGSSDKPVCYVGGITEARGIREMIGSVSRTNLRLSLAGVFHPEELKGEVQTQLGWDKVDEKGFLDRGQVADLLSNSLAGLVILHPTTSYQYSYPIKLFEYMAAGIPFIASDFPVWRELVKGVKCGLFVNPLDQKDIAKAIQYLADHPDEARLMGERGRKLIEEKYNWKVEEEKILKLYAHLQQN